MTGIWPKQFHAGAGAARNKANYPPAPLRFGNNSLKYKILFTDSVLAGDSVMIWRRLPG
jgi:hypothetical protein